MNRLAEGIVGKVLALGICVVLAGILYLGAVVPVIGFYQDQQSALQERLALAQRLDTATRDLQRLRGLDEQWQGAGSQMLLTDDSDTTAAASIQSAVRGLIESGGGTLTNSQVLDPDQPNDRYRRIRVRVSFAGDLPLLTQVLRGIDVAKPGLFVDNLDIRAAGAAADDSDDAGPKLNIAFDVYGFRAL
jgi:general secretion pathway protein M